MSDTITQECKCCATDGDCIDGLCLSCAEYNRKSITEHPDVQRLIADIVLKDRQIADLKLRITSHTKKLTKKLLARRRRGFKLSILRLKRNADHS